MISINVGVPSHGWLPVDFRHLDFHLEFHASDVLNDPLQELYNAVTKLRENELRQIIWWLEPGAYFFDIEKRGGNVILTISETEDLQNEKAEKEVIYTINGDDVQILKPFRAALKTFSSLTYDEEQWPYKFEKRKIEAL